MRIPGSVKAFFDWIVSSILLRSDPTPPSQRSSSSSIDSESQADAVQLVAQQNHQRFLLQWQNAVMAFCFTSAVEVAVLFAQIKSQLPFSFHILSFAILLIFLSLFVANFIGHDFAVITQVFEFVAVILVVTTVVFTIAIPFPLSLKCVTWALYAISLFTVLICRYFF